MIDHKIEVPSPSPYHSSELIDQIALQINQLFRINSRKVSSYKLNIDLLLDWLEISIYADDFDEPEGATFFACFDANDGGVIQINSKHETFFEARPDVYLNCVGHEIGHAVLRHYEHSSINEDQPLFGNQMAKPVLLHRSTWHQYGITAAEVKSRQAQIENQRDEWVKKALINSQAREALKQLNERFEPEWMFRQAEHFAKCLTIPLDQLSEILAAEPLVPGWSPIYRLAEKFGVSATNMKIRLLKLKLIETGKDGHPTPVSINDQISLF